MTDSIAVFLHEIYNRFHQGLDLRHCIIILGNESFDLDSCVSTLILALGLSRSDHELISVPVMNCDRADLRLRPDIISILAKVNINPASLIFIDDLPESFLSKITAVALVDHNRLSIKQQYLSPHVRIIFDHHRDEGGFSHIHRRYIMTAASAATIVALHSLDQDLLTHHDLAFLILAAIVADSSNFCPILNRITEFDRQVLDQIQGSTSHINREQLHDLILSARSDVSSLTTLELLRRDLKIVENRSIRVPISVIPESIQTWQQRQPDWYRDVQTFCRQNGLKFAIVMATFKNVQKEAQRQVSIIFDGQNQEVVSSFRSCLLSHGELQLKLLTELSDSSKIFIFQQQNLQYTRKALLPIVQEWLIQYHDHEHCL